METKKEIRTRLLKLRMEFPDEACAEQAKKVAEKLFLHPWYQGCGRLFCYVSFRKEVDTFAIMKRALQDEKALAVPKVRDTTMDFYEIRDFSELQKGAYGILEPRGEQLLFPQKDDLMLVPGAAFDRNGYRIGYGGGYYDRYLRRHPDMKTIALAYDFQIISRVPAEEFDVPAGEVLFPQKQNKQTFT